jgi:hypothetical protein
MATFLQCNFLQRPEVLLLLSNVRDLSYFIWLYSAYSHNDKTIQWLCKIYTIMWVPNLAGYM